MKSIKELRTTLNFYPHEINCWLKHMTEKNIDFDVFLESSDDNLQRSHVWKKEDKIDFVDDMINNLDFSNFGNIIIDISDVKKIISYIFSKTYHTNTKPQSLVMQFLI